MVQQIVPHLTLKGDSWHWVSPLNWMIWREGYLMHHPSPLTDEGFVAPGPPFDCEVVAQILTVVV